MRRFLPVLLIMVALAPIVAVGVSSAHEGSAAHQVTVPEADRFTPFAMTIHVGDRVRWLNNDGDDHTVVTDNAFTTAGHIGTDRLITANGGTLVLRFNHPGVFVYYCRFHAHLDSFNQPVAPGPEGGIQDQNGNYGTPMSGVITVVGEGD